MDSYWHAPAEQVDTCGHNDEAVGEDGYIHCLECGGTYRPD